MDNITSDMTKSPEADDFEIKTQIHSGKSLSYANTNGVLKRQRYLHLHLNNNNNNLPPPAPVAVLTYKECLKNHAAALGGHALDGCGEFMPSPTANPNDPTSLKCAACGCHRNFHRREPDDHSPPPQQQQLLLPQPLSTTASHVIEYQPHHRHHPPPPPPRGGSPSPQSPPPISSSYYPSSAPHMLLALSTGLPSPLPPENLPLLSHTATPTGTKRFRTKFSPIQKEKMFQLAERVGWKMQKKDDELVLQFCKETGVDRGVFKVWMHNNKNTLGKKFSSDFNGGNENGLENSNHNNNNNNSNEHIQNENNMMIGQHHSAGSEHGGTNGSSSSS